MRVRKGFTLVELAIALVILGILVGIGVSVLLPLLGKVKARANLDRLKANLQDLYAYAINNRTIPTSLNTSGVKYLKDAYGNPLYYIYDPNLANQDICKAPPNFQTNITVVECLNQTCTQNRSINNVALVLISPGRNRNNQTHGSGNASVPLTLIVPYKGSITDNYPGDVNRREKYDDQILYATLNDLKVNANCRDEYRITLSPPGGSLPYATVNTSYGALISIMGGLPSYSVGVGGSLPAGVTLSCGGTPITPSATCTPNVVCSAPLTISGTPTQTGTFNFTVCVRDSYQPVSNTQNATYYLSVLSAYAGGGGGGAGGGGGGAGGGGGGTPPSSSGTSSNPAYTVNNGSQYITVGSGGSAGTTYPGGNLQNNNKNIYVSFTCNGSTGCGGGTFTEFGLQCVSNCTVFNNGTVKFDKLSYSIYNYPSQSWTIIDQTVYKCRNCPLPFPYPTAFNRGSISYGPGQRIALEIRFRQALPTGNYTFRIDLGSGGVSTTSIVFTVSVP